MHCQCCVAAAAYAWMVVENTYNCPPPSLSLSHSLGLRAHVTSPICASAAARSPMRTTTQSPGSYRQSRLKRRRHTGRRRGTMGGPAAGASGDRFVRFEILGCGSLPAGAVLCAILLEEVRLKGSVLYRPTSVANVSSILILPRSSVSGAFRAFTQHPPFLCTRS